MAELSRGWCTTNPKIIQYVIPGPTSLQKLNLEPPTYATVSHTYLSPTFCGPLTERFYKFSSAVVMSWRNKTLDAHVNISSTDQHRFTSKIWSRGLLRMAEHNAALRTRGQITASPPVRSPGDNALPCPRCNYVSTRSMWFRYISLIPLTAILLLMQFCEPITATVIFPFVFQLVNETGVTKGNADRTGYYAGIIVRLFLFFSPHADDQSEQQSTFFLVETLFVLQWGRLSDKIGRKPVILVGLLGLTLSMLCFGLSRTFPALVASRSLVGLLNGNVGVLKSMLGELTDDTNLAQGFAFLPIVWSMGATIGYVDLPG